MSILDVISMCLRNLVKRKLRTFLTLLGVMIGTGSIIIMISLGLATDAQFARMIEDLNLDMTEVQVAPQWAGGRWNPDTGQMEQAEQRDLTDDSVARIRALPGVRVATPLMRGQLFFTSGPYAMSASITGIDPEAMALMGLETSSGRLLEDGDGFSVVFGSHAELNFFDSSDSNWWMADRFWQSQWDEMDAFVDIFNDPIRMYYDTEAMWRRIWQTGADDGGMEIEETFRQIRSFELNIVGVLEPNEWDHWENGVIYMDIEMLHILTQMGQESAIRAREEDEWFPQFSGRTGGLRETYDQLFVRAETMDDTADVARAIREMGYQAWFNAEMIDSQRRNQQAMQALLAAIAAVSLFVAAINIANTMVTSVTERTREIGIMKVIGASLRDIRGLFLTEAIFIGLLGGLFGIGLALMGSYALNNFEIEFLQNLNMSPPITTEGVEGAVTSLITPWLMGVALALASGVGLVSGIFPAWHATRLSALAAIRTD